MYEELIAALRFCDGGECDGCCRYKKEHGAECYTLLRDAADAIEERDNAALTIQHEMMAEAESHIALVERLNKRIEELELHYCSHAIRNVHDRGDDSICEKYKCEVTALPRWIPATEPPKEDGWYQVYAPGYLGGSSSGLKNIRGNMYSAFKNGKWSIEVGYHKRPGCVKAWMPLPEPPKEDSK